MSLPIQPNESPIDFARRRLAVVDKWLAGADDAVQFRKVSDDYPWTPIPKAATFNTGNLLNWACCLMHQTASLSDAPITRRMTIDEIRALRPFTLKLTDSHLTSIAGRGNPAQWAISEEVVITDRNLGIELVAPDGSRGLIICDLTRASYSVDSGRTWKPFTVSITPNP